MRFLQKLRPLAPFLFLALITCLIYYQVIFFGKILYGTFDNFDYMLPAKYFLVDQLRHGVFPLWNPYIFTGIPYFADITLGTLNVFNILYFLFPPARALGINIALSVFLLGVFQYLFLRLLKIAKIPSLLGAVLYTFGDIMFYHTGAVDVVQVNLFIPLLFIFLLLLRNKKNMLYYFVIILFQAMQILSGHPRMTYYTILFVSLYMFFCLSYSWKKKVVLLGFYYVGAFLLTTVQTFPFLEYVFSSNRPLSSIAFANSEHLSPVQLITFFFPTFFGTHKEGNWWGPQLMFFGYMTIPGYIALAIGWLRGKVQHKMFFVLSLLLTVFLAVGKISPIYLIFYYLVPGWKLFRAPVDIMIYFAFFASILMAIGFEYLFTHAKNFTLRIRKPFILFAAGSTFLLTLFLYTGSDAFFWKDFFLFLSRHSHISLLQKLLIYDGIKLQAMFQGVVWNFLFFSTSITITFLLVLLFVNRSKALSLTMLIFVAFILVYIDSMTIMTVPLSLEKVGKDVPKVLSNVQNGNYRILTIPVDLHQKREHLVIPNYFFQESRIKLLTYVGNNNLQNMLSQMNATSPLIPTSLAKYVSSSLSNESVVGIDFTRISQNQLNNTSTKYIIANNPLATYSGHLILISKSPNRYIYENPSARKRAYLLSDPLGNEVTLNTFLSDKLIFTVHAKKTSQLIVTDLYYPGWIATVNEEQVKILPYEKTFQQVTVPKGTSRVVLSYQPKSFVYGLAVSIGSTVVFCVSFLVALFMRTKRRKNK